MTGTRALDWLRPRSIEPLKDLVGEPDDLEWGRRDGLAVEVWPGVLRARDLGQSPRVRAAAVAGLVPEGAVLVRQSAVWVHTGRHRPSRLDVVPIGARSRSSRLVHVHAEHLDPAEVVDLGTGTVSSAARTVVDVARWSKPQDATSWVNDLVATGLDVDDLSAVLGRATGLPGVTRARRLLAPLLTATLGSSG